MEVLCFLRPSFYWNNTFPTIYFDHGFPPLIPPNLPNIMFFSLSLSSKQKTKKHIHKKIKTNKQNTSKTKKKIQNQVQWNLKSIKYHWVPYMLANYSGMRSTMEYGWYTQWDCSEVWKLRLTMPATQEQVQENCKLKAYLGYILVVTCCWRESHLLFSGRLASLEPK